LARKVLTTIARRRPWGAAIGLESGIPTRPGYLARADRGDDHPMQHETIVLVLDVRIGASWW